ncbi:MAG: DUF4125 family protein [Spirochaetales bacterium]|uniref:DUF4125 family protein n=1 Tax=Candidatus Thalassospirochaeta sargassi TaxID=3119039 RepID=A0AAJ1IJC7_9SPIO|nr:DUF4125 family protein [Spirochaetales bacterium]
MNILEEVLTREHAMLMAVNAEGDPECRKHADEFKKHRSAQFSVWFEATLESYLDDLMVAEAENRNLMTYKYARMDNLIPSENNDPLIETITAIQIAWQLEMAEKYPGLMKNARGIVSAENSELSVTFAGYLSAELESYSGKTLKLLFQDIEGYKKKGINMSEKIYEKLIADFGYSSLADFESAE